MGRADSDITPPWDPPGDVTTPPPPTSNAAANPHYSYSEHNVDADVLQLPHGRRILFAVGACVLLLVVLAAVRLLTPKSWDPALEPYVAFVEAERGLIFKEPVDVRWADIAAELADWPVDSDVEGDAWADAYELLGLIDTELDPDAAAAANETLVESAFAYYDSWEEEIVLPEGVSEIELSFVVVHELVHALQHQHGLLGSFVESPDGATARIVLVEGDADRIAVAWFASRSEDFQDDYFAAIGADSDAASFDEGNSYFETSFQVAYTVGRPMVETIIEAEGVEALDRLLRAKDAGTTERLLDPLATSRSSSVDAQVQMSNGGGAAIQGDLGALTWFQALAPVLGTEAAFDALLGYDDDAFAVITDDDGATCGRFSVFFDSPLETMEFADLVEPLGVSSLLARSQSKVVELEICEPIGDPALQRYGTILPLVVANDQTSAHLRDGVAADVARCAALAQAKTIPADRPADDFVGWDVVDEQAAEFLGECREALRSQTN